MAFVFLDLEAFKITFEIVEDFINFDFQGFLEKDFDKTKPRIITWEMNIFLKLLNDQSKGFVNYYLLQIKKKLEEDLNTLKYFHVEPSEKQNRDYIKTFSNSDEEKGKHFITIEVQICKNPAIIKIIFYCDESTRFKFSKKFVKNKYLKNHKELRRITYLNQMCHLITQIMVDLELSEYSRNLIGIENVHNTIKNSIFNSLESLKNFNYDLIESLHYIAEIHYCEIICNLYKTFFKSDDSNYNFKTNEKIQARCRKWDIFFSGMKSKIFEILVKISEKSEEISIKITDLIHTVQYIYKFPNIDILDEAELEYLAEDFLQSF